MLETVFSQLFLITFLTSTIRMAAPILLSALGEIYAEKSGSLNISLEAQMLTAALAGFIGAYYTQNNWLGLLVGMLAGIAISLLFALLTVTLRADQIVVGITLNLFALGLTTFIYRVLFGVAVIPPHVEPMTEVHIPVLSNLPFIGPIFFQQKAVVYLTFLLVPVAHWFLFHTTLGLKIRSVGEYPLAAETVGINVVRTRYLCILLSGLGAGLGGAFLSVGQLARFTDNMTAGRGFIALAIVIFGQWKPYRAALAALIFAAADALQLSLQAVGVQIPSQFLLMLPYGVTILAMIFVARRATAPAALAQPYVKEG
ncbi:MAG: ABC transporter permease [Anaerolineae bacterium]